MLRKVISITWGFVALACAAKAPMPPAARSPAKLRPALSAVLTPAPKPAGAANESGAASTHEEPAEPPAPVLDDGVPRCEGSDTFLAAELHADDSIRIVEFKLNGERVKTWFEQKDRLHPAIDLRAKLAIGIAGLTDLTSGNVTPLTYAERWAFPMFVPGKPWVVSWVSDSDPDTTDIFDYKRNSLVTSISGTGPAIGPGGEILFLVKLPDVIEVKRYDAGRIRSLKRIPLADHGVQDVSHLVALGGDQFVYRVDDDHEHRYYLANDQPFFPGTSGHWIDFKNKSRAMGPNKEQYDLTLSANGKWAAFAERNWNELTYLVIVDRKARERHETPFNGSFPAWFGNTLVFASNPAFVRSDDPQFRQIEQFVLYAYEARTRSLCKIGGLDHDASPYGPHGP